MCVCVCAHVCSVQDGIYALGKVHPVSRKFPQSCLWNCLSDWQLPSLVLSRKIMQCFLFPRLSLWGDQWCNVLGFVPVGSVSSFSTFQIFWGTNHLRCFCVACQTICLVISLHSGMSRAGHPQEFSKVAVDHWHIPVWASHATFCSKLIDDVMCGLTVTSWGNPMEDMGDCFRLHCQAGFWDRTGCTVFMNGGHTLLDSEAPPWLVCVLLLLLLSLYNIFKWHNQFELFPLLTQNMSMYVCLTSLCTCYIKTINLSHQTNVRGWFVAVWSHIQITKVTSPLIDQLKMVNFTQNTHKKPWLQVFMIFYYIMFIILLIPEKCLHTPVTLYSFTKLFIHRYFVFKWFYIPILNLT